jgi:sugar phosphate isomerase/epimerase
MSTTAIVRKIDLLGMWVERAACSGVTLCIENLSEHAPHLAPALERLPRLAITLDLGHGEILSQPNAAYGIIERFPRRIRHVHLHDNYGGNTVQDDLHLPIGQGNIDFSSILRSLLAAGYDGRFSFEVPREHVIQCREAIRTMLHDGPVS